jgi:PAS domain S-box-containing protein
LSTPEERVYFKDLMSRFLFVSTGWIATYAPGSSPRDLVGKTDFDIFGGEYAAGAFEDEQRIIRTGEPVTGKVERETYRGADTWVSITKMPLRDAAGAIIGTFGITRDITAQVEAEHTLARQALALSNQNEALRELDRLKDEFIGLVSHELRTPLTSIIGYVELLREQGASGQDTGSFLEVIERNSNRLLHLVGDLLFLSGLQSGKIAMEFSDTDLAEMTTTIVEELRPEAERKRIELTATVCEVPRWRADPVRIGQLLGNLVSNAVKFTPEGGKVTVGLRMNGGEAVLTVRDTGIGICRSDRDQIFERFFRGSLATARAIPGTGLGLTIARAIVEAHQGTVTVDSDEGHGATFEVRLPAHGAVRRRAGPRPGPARALRSR